MKWITFWLLDLKPSTERACCPALQWTRDSCAATAHLWIHSAAWPSVWPPFALDEVRAALAVATPLEVTITTPGPTSTLKIQLSDSIPCLVCQKTGLKGRDFVFSCHPWRSTRVPRLKQPPDICHRKHLSARFPAQWPTKGWSQSRLES